MLNAYDIDQMGKLITDLGTPQFGPTFYGFFNSLFHLKQCTVFAFPRSVSPLSLCAEGCDADNCSTARDLAKEYVAGECANDPNIVGTLNGQPNKRLRIFSRSADQLEDKRYKRRFYDEPGLARKMVILASIDDTLYYANFYRGPGEPSFHQNDHRLLQTLAGITLKTLVRHIALTKPKPVSVPRSPKPSILSDRHCAYARLRNVLLNQRRGITQREAEICAGILLGYSTVALALMLGISTNTVATHRKHAYARLGVSGQSGLFGLCFQSLIRS